MSIYNEPIYAVTNRLGRELQVRFNGVDVPEKPLPDGATGYFPYSVAKHIEKRLPPLRVDGRSVPQVELDAAPNIPAMGMMEPVTQQTFKDEETGIAYETLEAYTAALKARFLAATTQGPQSPPPAAAAVSAPVFPTAPTLQGQAKNEPPSFKPNLPKR